MRRNFASLNLQALSAAACDDELADEPPSPTSIDEEQTTISVALLRLDDDDDEDLDHPFYSSACANIGCPIEMVATPTTLEAQQSVARPRPMSPASAIPHKNTALPSIRLANNEPVRRFITLSSSVAPPSSKLSMSTGTRGLRAECLSGPPLLVPVQRNMIQSV